MEVLLPRGQSGPGGFAMLRAIRKISASPPFSDSGFGFNVFGEYMLLMDMIDIANAEAPAILGTVTTVAVLLMAGLAFRSLLIPLRLLLTILVTLLVVAAAAVLYFEHFLGQDGLYW